jgi:hypothetical protein
VNVKGHEEQANALYMRREGGNDSGEEKEHAKAKQDQ